MPISTSISTEHFLSNSIVSSTPTSCHISPAARGKRNAMSSNAATIMPTESPTTTQPKHRSISQSIKAAGFIDLNNMMNSYGLKRENQEDFEEARAILDAFNQRDQNAWEASQNKSENEGSSH